MPLLSGRNVRSVLKHDNELYFPFRCVFVPEERPPLICTAQYPCGFLPRYGRKGVSSPTEIGLQFTNHFFPPFSRYFFHNCSVPIGFLLSDSGSLRCFFESRRDVFVPEQVRIPFYPRRLTPPFTPYASLRNFPTLSAVSRLRPVPQPHAPVSFQPDLPAPGDFGCMLLRGINVGINVF